MAEISLALSLLFSSLIVRSNINELESLVSDLKEKGLDGIEAIYENFTKEQQEQLCSLAKNLGLYVSAGTDTHEIKLHLDTNQSKRNDVTRNHYGN